MTFTYSGSAGGRLDSQTLSSGSSSSQDAQLWPWRDEFKSHISKISMALSERIKQTCEKALDDEMQLYRSSKRITTVKLKGLKVSAFLDYMSFTMAQGFEKFKLLCIVFFFCYSSFPINAIFVTM